MDLNLEKFFDRVHHDILMRRLARRIGDKRIQSERASQRVLASVTDFLQRKLKLKVNKDESVVAYPIAPSFMDPIADFA